ncbi:MAG TPA: ATP-dependent DNA helicase, partial [Aldersonia sp.]
MPPLPDVPQLLAAAVAALGGTERAGQLTMASAVAHAIDTHTHLAVQAGTGTGKSLAYLVPGIRHALQTGRTVVVSTATIALQRQLVERDLPRLAAALGPLLGEEPEFAILKGRNNYLCLNKIRTGVTDDPAEPELFDAFAVSRLGRDVQRLHKWAEQTETGDRDEVVPGVSDRAWRQLSVTARECLGKARCPHGVDCFAELARNRSAQVDVVVTNHALLAIDAISGLSVLPEHDVVIVDEAHELVDRVTGVATAELSPASITAAVRRTGKLVPEDELDRMQAAADALERLLSELNPGRWDAFPSGADAVLALVRDAAWAVRTAVAPSRSGPSDPAAAAARAAALAALDEVHDAAARTLTAFDDPDPAARKDVVWLEDGRDRRTIRIAPLSVGGLLRSRLFETATVILTSATLQLGGSFDTLARTWGLPAHERDPRGDAALATGAEPPSDEAEMAWTGLDVGSPFDHARAGILYVAKHLPAPGRDGLA